MPRVDSCFPCFLFQNCPEALRPRTQNDSDDSETEEQAAEEATDEEAPATEQHRGRLLKDENGYYVSPPDLPILKFPKKRRRIVSKKKKHFDILGDIIAN